MFDSMRKALKDVGLSSGAKQGSAAAGGRPSDLSGATLTVAERQMLVEEMFAEGGMARVYRARELSTGTRVAVKQMLIPADRQDAQIEAEREADLHARLSDHPNVVALFSRDVSRAEAHRQDGGFVQTLLVMELCERSLAQHINSHVEAKTRMTEEEVLTAFAACSGAVGYMHSKSPPLIHRDVKPENLLLAPDGLWKLCDFGSVMVGEMAMKTPTERARAETDVGKNTTPTYRAPEMWDVFRWGAIGKPADAWALGCLLYQLCFQRLPFGAEAKMAALNGTYSLPNGHGRSAGVVRLISELLKVEPSERPAAADLVARAERLVETGGVVEGEEVEAEMTVGSFVNSDAGMTVGSFANSDAGDEGGWANFDDNTPAAFAGHGHGAAPGWTSFDDTTPSVGQSAEVNALKARLADALASNRRLTEQLSAAVETVSSLRGEIDALKRGSEPSAPSPRLPPPGTSLPPTSPILPPRPSAAVTSPVKWVLKSPEEAVEKKVRINSASGEHGDGRSEEKVLESVSSIASDRSTPRHTRTRSEPNPSFKYFEYGAFEDEDDENDPGIPANARKTGKGYALL